MSFQNSPSLETDFAQGEHAEEQEGKRSKSKKKKKTAAEHDQYGNFRSVKVTSKGKVIIGFARQFVKPLHDGQDTNDISDAEYQVKAKEAPHKDFYDAMKNLRKHALALLEMDGEDFTTYSVIEFKIKGDIDKKNSRVNMVLGKRLRRNDKTVKFGPTGDVSMYGNSDYSENEELTTLVLAAIDEIYAYLGGKYADDTDGQLPLFHFRYTRKPRSRRMRPWVCLPVSTPKPGS